MKFGFNSLVFFLFFFFFFFFFRKRSLKMLNVSDLGQRSINDRDLGLS